MRILLLALMLPLAAAAGSYELADLKALEKDQSWPELVEHLTDVPPSKRDAEWKAMAERACAKLLASEEIKDVATAETALSQIEAFHKRFAWLKDSKVFLAARADAGLKAMKWTYQNSRHSSGDDPWLDSLKAFVAVDQQTADLALRAAKLVTSRLIPSVAFPLLKTALAKGGVALCKDADLQRSVLEALGDGLWKKDIGEVLSTCWGDLKPLVVAEVMKADTSRTIRMKLCVPLLDKGALSSAEEKARCTFE